MKRDVFNGASKQKAADCACIYMYMYVYIHIHIYIFIHHFDHYVMYTNVFTSHGDRLHIYIYIYVYIEHTVHGRNPAQVGNYW